jgi:dihydroflavonol-4-reductase
MTDAVQHNQERLAQLLKGYDKSKPVVVTGVDGYLAGVLVQQLLSHGFVVHGTHIQTFESNLNYLTSLPRAEHNLKLFRSNLLDEGSFDAAFHGCEVAFHTASPFLLQHGLDVKRQLVQPAVEGTRNVLQTCNRTPTLRRVVLTSSVGAVFGDAADCADSPVDETTWNRTSTFTHQPYFYSKTLAEQEAWIIAGSQTQWSLVVINPAMILGPGLRYFPNSESFKTIYKCGSGHWLTWFGSPTFAMPAVDIRDVVTAHMVSGFDVAVTGRHILCSANSSLPEFCQILSRIFPNYPIPRILAPIPIFALALVAPLLRQGIDRKAVWRNCNCRTQLDATKSIKGALNMRYRPLEVSLRDMYQQMIEAGAVQPGSPPELYGLSIVLLACFAMASPLNQYYQSFRSS